MTPSDRRNGALHADQLAFLVARALTILEASPRGASRRDLLGALHVQPGHWPTLRTALEQTGQVVAVGRGPGLRHVHKAMLEGQVPSEAARSRAGAREAIVALLQEKGAIYSRDAQLVTGLGADAVRRILGELIRARKVTSEGQKRSTKYRWKG